MDPSQALQSVLDEFKTLRISREADANHIGNLAIRIGLSQMAGNVIQYSNAAPEWNELVSLWESGRLSIDHTGEVHLDRKRLTRELLKSLNTNRRD